MDVDTDDDNATNWPGPPIATTVGTGTVESYLPGIVNTADTNTTVRPGDRIEYTISFLSDGLLAAKDVLLCDRIPTNTTFVPDAFNELTPAFSGGGSRGIRVTFTSSDIALTNANDGDEISKSGTDIGGYYFPPGADLSLMFPNISCGPPNDNGMLVVEISNLPSATAEGTPINAYGFIRFRAAVN